MISPVAQGDSRSSSIPQRQPARTGSTLLARSFPRIARVRNLPPGALSAPARLSLLIALVSHQLAPFLESAPALPSSPPTPSPSLRPFQPMQTLSPPDPATITQPHLTAAPGPTSSHSSSTSPAPFHLNATASTSSLRSSPDTELPAADLDGGRPVRAKRAADADSLWDLGDGGGSEGDDRPTTDAQPSSRSAKPGSAAAKGKRKAAGSARVSKGDSEVWGVEVDAALHKAGESVSLQQT